MEHICNCIYVQHGQRHSAIIIGAELNEFVVLTNNHTKNTQLFPYWGNDNQGVRPKGEYGRLPLRADQFCMLDTYGQWLSICINHKTYTQVS